MSSPYRTPPPTAATTPWARMIAKTTGSGSPGTARTAVATPKASARPVVAARGGSRSAADISRVAPIIWASEEPNMDRAASSGESVAA